MKRAAEAPLAERIVDAALDFAEEVGWEGLRLRQVAARLDVPLAEVLVHYRDLDAIADAWFRRAWSAMLGMSSATPSSPGVATQWLVPSVISTVPVRG